MENILVYANANGKVVNYVVSGEEVNWALKEAKMRPHFCCLYYMEVRILENMKLNTVGMRYLKCICINREAVENERGWIHTDCVGEQAAVKKVGW